MKSKKILYSELSPLLISSLPARPNQSASYGGAAYSSSELRAAFDKLPLLLAERYNDLLSDIESGELCENLATGLSEGSTLKSFFEDLSSGVWAGYSKIDGTPIYTLLRNIEDRLAKLEEVSEK